MKTLTVILSFAVCALSLNTPAYAAKKKKTVNVLCAQASGALVTKPKCKKNERKIGLGDLGTVVSESIAGGIQGPQGAQGPQGPVGIQGIQGPSGSQGAQGPAGNPGSFNLNDCYEKTGPISNVGANAVNFSSVSCNVPASQFMLSSSIGMAPIGSTVNKPYIQSKDLILDISGKYPVGVTYSAFQAVSGGSSYGIQVFIICCNK